MVIVEAPWKRRIFTSGFAEEMSVGFDGAGDSVGGVGCGFSVGCVTGGGVGAGASTGGGGGNIGRGAAQDAAIDRPIITTIL